MIKVLPSTNPCPEKDLVKYVKKLENMDIEYLHCDVMDGKFVENKCLDYSVVEQIRNNTNILLDVHLMVYDCFENVQKFAELNPNIITIHYESPKSLKEMIKIFKYLRSKDIMAGISIKPNTPVDILEGLLDYVDLILIMSVEPGKSGQEFLPESLQKIKDVKEMIAGKNIILEVDGGINLDNYKKVVSSGAEFLVIGSAFYKSKEKEVFLNTIDKHYKLNN